MTTTTLAGWTGDNLSTPSTNMPWYTGFEVEMNNQTIRGTTLLEALDRVIQPPRYRAARAPFRMAIRRFHRVTKAGYVLAGRVLQGSLKPEANVRCWPAGIPAVVKSVERHHQPVDMAFTGDQVGVLVKNFPNRRKREWVGVLCVDDETSGLGPVERFTAKIEVTDSKLSSSKSERLMRATQRNASGKVLVRGYTPIIYAGTHHCECRLVEILSTEQQHETDMLRLHKDDVAVVVFEPVYPFFVQPFDECEGLGTIIGLDSNKLVLKGRVLEVEYQAKVSA